MKKRVTLINSISALVLQFVTIVSGFIIPRLLLSSFGSEVNGLISSLNQFLSYISLIEGGVTSVIAANLYKPLQKKDDKEISNVVLCANKFFKRIAIIFSIYAVILSLTYGLFTKTFFSFGYICSLTLILSINLFMQYFFSITWKTLLQADKKVYIVSNIQTFCVVLNTLSTIVLIKLFPNIHIIKLISAVIFIFQPIFLNRYVNKNYNIDKNVELDNSVLKQRWDGFGINVAYTIHSNTDVVILTIFSTLKNISVYSMYLLVVNSLKNLASFVTKGFTPSLGIALAEGNKEKINKLFSRYELLTYYVSFILFNVGGIMITPFVQIYTAVVTDANYFQPVLGWLLIVAELIYCIRDPYLTVAYCSNKFKEISKHAYIEAAINIITSLIFVFKYGIIGVAVGTVAAMLYRTIYHIFYIKKNIMFRSVGLAFKKIIVFGLTFIVVSYLSTHFFAMGNLTLINWILYAICNTIFSACVYSLVSWIFFKDEVKMILSYFNINIK